MVLVGCGVWLSSIAGAQSAGQTVDNGQAQDASGGPDQPDEKGYLERTLKFSGSIRERWEATDGPFSATPASSYVLSQIRLGLQFTPTPWLQFFAQAQDARALFYETPPSNTVSDSFDLRQAWMAVGRREGPRFYAQLGRQEMVIGSGRLLAATDVWWANTARTFDVVHGSYSTSFLKTEIVAGSVVLVNPTGFDEHKPGDHIFAEYNAFSRLLPGASVEPYFFAHTTLGVASKDKVLGEMDTLAAGGRIVGKLRGGVDYSFEALHEFGNYSNDRLNAAGLVAGGGWKITQSGWAPRISSDYAYASGDDGRKDDSRETFDNMYGYNQPMNSVTGQFGWKNIKDLRTGVEFAPLRRLKVKLDGRDLWLASTADGLYNAAGTRTVYDTKATNAHVGETIEMLSTVTVTRSTSVGFGVGTLFSGAYLQEAHKGHVHIPVHVSVPEVLTSPRGGSRSSRASIREKRGWPFARAIFAWIRQYGQSHGRRSPPFVTASTAFFRNPARQSGPLIMAAGCDGPSPSSAPHPAPDVWACGSGCNPGPRHCAWSGDNPGRPSGIRPASSKNYAAGDR